MKNIKDFIICILYILTFTTLFSSCIHANEFEIFTEIVTAPNSKSQWIDKKIRSADCETCKEKRPPDYTHHPFNCYRAKLGFGVKKSNNNKQFWPLSNSSKKPAYSPVSKKLALKRGNRIPIWVCLPGKGRKLKQLPTIIRLFLPMKSYDDTLINKGGYVNCDIEFTVSQNDSKQSKTSPRFQGKAYVDPNGTIIAFCDDLGFNIHLKSLPPMDSGNDPFGWDVSVTGVKIKDKIVSFGKFKTNPFMLWIFDNDIISIEILIQDQASPKEKAKLIPVQLTRSQRNYPIDVSLYHYINPSIKQSLDKSGAFVGNDIFEIVLENLTTEAMDGEFVFYSAGEDCKPIDWLHTEVRYPNDGIFKIKKRDIGYKRIDIEIKGDPKYRRIPIYPNERNRNSVNVSKFHDLKPIDEGNPYDIKIKLNHLTMEAKRGPFVFYGVRGDGHPISWLCTVEKYPANGIIIVKNIKKFYKEVKVEIRGNLHYYRIPIKVGSSDHPYIVDTRNYRKSKKNDEFKPYPISIKLRKLSPDAANGPIVLYGIRNDNGYENIIVALGRYPKSGVINTCINDPKIENIEVELEGDSSYDRINIYLSSISKGINEFDASFFRSSDDSGHPASLTHVETRNRLDDENIIEIELKKLTNAAKKSEFVFYEVGEGCKPDTWLHTEDNYPNGEIFKFHKGDKTSKRIEVEIKGDLQYRRIPIELDERIKYTVDVSNFHDAILGKKSTPPYRIEIKLSKLSEDAKMGQFVLYGVREDGSSYIWLRTVEKYPADGTIIINNFKKEYTRVDVEVRGDMLYSRIPVKIKPNVFLYPVDTNKYRASERIEQFTPYPVWVTLRNLTPKARKGTIVLNGVFTGKSNETILSELERYPESGVIEICINDPNLIKIRIELKGDPHYDRIEVILSLDRKDYIEDASIFLRKPIIVRIDNYKKLSNIIGDPWLEVVEDRIRIPIQSDGTFTIYRYTPDKTYRLISDYYRYDIKQIPKAPIKLSNKVIPAFDELYSNDVRDIFILAESNDKSRRIKLGSIEKKSFTIPDLEFSSLLVTYIKNGEYYNVPFDFKNNRFIVKTRPIFKLEDPTHLNQSFHIEYYNEERRQKEKILKAKGVEKITFPASINFSKGFIAYFDKFKGRRKPIIVTDNSVMNLIDTAAIIIIDFNRTGENNSMKQSKDYLSFVNRLIELTDNTNILVYKFLNVITYDTSFFDRHDIDIVYVREYEKFDMITRNNVRKFWDHIKQSKNPVASDKAFDLFYSFESLRGKKIQSIKNTDVQEKTYSKNYQKILSLLQNRIDEMHYDIETQIYISYSKIEKPDPDITRKFKLYCYRNDQQKIISEINQIISRR